VTREIVPPYYSVKEAVFPFAKFPGVDTILGPEMKSTGEVMGVGRTFAEAFVKSQLAAGTRLPKSGKVFISVKRADDQGGRGGARLASSASRCRHARHRRRDLAAGIPVGGREQGAEGRPHIVDMIKNGEIALIVNTVEEKRRRSPTRAPSAPGAGAARHAVHHHRGRGRAACAGMRHDGRTGNLFAAGAARRTRNFRHEQVPITKRGAEMLRQELQRLKTVDRPNVIAAIAEARAHGDLSENAEYDAAKERQSFIEGRIRRSRASWATRRSSIPRCSMPTAAASSAPPSTWKTGERRQGHLPDRRRRRGRPEEEQDLHQLADRARPDRQVRRRHRRGARRPAARARVRGILDVLSPRRRRRLLARHGFRGRTPEHQQVADMLNIDAVERAADFAAKGLAVLALDAVKSQFDQLMGLERTIDLGHYRRGKPFLADRDDGLEMVGGGAQGPALDGGDFNHGGILA
jgi:hypothetical protein